MTINVIKNADGSYNVVLLPPPEETGGKGKEKMPALSADAIYTCPLGGTVLGMTWDELEQMGQGEHEVVSELLSPRRLIEDKADCMADILGGIAGDAAVESITRVTGGKKKKKTGK